MSRLITESFLVSKQHFTVENKGKLSRDVCVANPEPKPKVTNRKHDLEILRDFDLALEYGPAAGISRLERWQRAQKHGLNPPAEVRDLIMEHSSDVNYVESLWNEYDI